MMEDDILDFGEEEDDRSDVISLGGSEHAAEIAAPASGTQARRPASPQKPTSNSRSVHRGPIHSPKLEQRETESQASSSKAQAPPSIVTPKPKERASYNPPDRMASSLRSNSAASGRYNSGQYDSYRPGGDDLYRGRDRRPRDSRGIAGRPRGGVDSYVPSATSDSHMPPSHGDSYKPSIHPNPPSLDSYRPSPISTDRDSLWRDRDRDSPRERDWDLRRPPQSNDRWNHSNDDRHMRRLPPHEERNSTLEPPDDRDRGMHRPLQSNNRDRGRDRRSRDHDWSRDYVPASDGRAASDGTREWGPPREADGASPRAILEPEVASNPRKALVSQDEIRRSLQTEDEARPTDQRVEARPCHSAEAHDRSEPQRPSWRLEHDSRRDGSRNHDRDGRDRGYDYDRVQGPTPGVGPETAPFQRRPVQPLVHQEAASLRDRLTAGPPQQFSSRIARSEGAGPPASSAAETEFKNSDLPSGWERRVSSRDKKAYYVNLNTRRSQWHLPTEPAKPYEEKDSSNPEGQFLMQEEEPTRREEDRVRRTDQEAKEADDLPRTRTAAVGIHPSRLALMEPNDVEGSPQQKRTTADRSDHRSLRDQAAPAPVPSYHAPRHGPSPSESAADHSLHDPPTQQQWGASPSYPAANPGPNEKYSRRLGPSTELPAPGPYDKDLASGHYSDSRDGHQRRALAFSREADRRQPDEARHMPGESARSYRTTLPQQPQPVPPSGPRGFTAAHTNDGPSDRSNGRKPQDSSPLWRRFTGGAPDQQTSMDAERLLPARVVSQSGPGADECPPRHRTPTAPRFEGDSRIRMGVEEVARGPQWRGNAPLPPSVPPTAPRGTPLQHSSVSRELPTGPRDAAVPFQPRKREYDSDRDERRPRNHPLEHRWPSRAYDSSWGSRAPGSFMFQEHRTTREPLPEGGREVSFRQPFHRSMSPMHHGSDIGSRKRFRSLSPRRRAFDSNHVKSAPAPQTRDEPAAAPMATSTSPLLENEAAPTASPRLNDSMGKSNTEQFPALSMEVDGAPPIAELGYLTGSVTNARPSGSGNDGMDTPHPSRNGFGPSLHSQDETAVTASVNPTNTTSVPCAPLSSGLSIDHCEDMSTDGESMKAVSDEDEPEDEVLIVGQSYGATASPVGLSAAMDNGNISTETEQAPVPESSLASRLQPRQPTTTEDMPAAKRQKKTLWDQPASAPPTLAPESTVQPVATPAPETPLSTVGRKIKGSASVVFTEPNVNSTATPTEPSSYRFRGLAQQRAQQQQQQLQQVRPDQQQSTSHRPPSSAEGEGRGLTGESGGKAAFGIRGRSSLVHPLPSEAPAFQQSAPRAGETGVASSKPLHERLNLEAQVSSADVTSQWRCSSLTARIAQTNAGLSSVADISNGSAEADSESVGIAASSDLSPGKGGRLGKRRGSGIRRRGK